MNNSRRSAVAALQRLLRNRSGGIGLVIVLAFILLAFLANAVMPFDPVEMHPQDRMQPPGPPYWFGTDMFGRDILSRLVWGARVSLRVAIGAVTGATVLGTGLGTVSGYAGGYVDHIIMRIMDVFFAFPAILLALAIVAVLGSSSENAILAIAIVYTPIFARVARGSVLSVKEMEYITAARAVGARTQRIIGRHILPNMVAPVIVQISLALSWAILTEAALSFLGLGTQPPEPSWGNMLNESRKMMELAPWMAIFPGAAIMLAVLGFNLLGDGLRDVLDPRLRQ